MRIGLLSDPHGDTSALALAVTTLRDAHCDEIWCLGDIVGEPAPGETLRLAHETCDVVIAGNHDLLVAGRIAEAYLESHGAAGINRIRGQVTPEELDALRALPAHAHSDELHAVHACIDHPTDHVNDHYDADNQLALAERPFLALGHSHRGFCFTADGRWFLEPNGRIDLGGNAVVCPGTLRPSPLRPGTVCVLDTEQAACEWHLLVSHGATLSTALTPGR